MAFLLKTKHLLLVALLAVCLALYSLIGDRGVTAPPPAPAPKNAGALNITGLFYSNYAGERLLSRLQAETLAVAPRKMGSFRIKSVNELVLRDVDFLLDLDVPPDLSADDSGGQAGQMSFGLKTLVDTKGMGRITRVVVEGLRLDLRKSGENHLEVTAAGGVFDLKLRELRMNDTVLAGVQGQRLVSALVVWDEAAKIFRVPGAYLITDKGEERRGEGALVDMEFNVLPTSANDRNK